MNTNIERLSQMLKSHFHFWTEVFKDEETGEEIPYFGCRTYALRQAFTNLDVEEKETEW